MSRHSIVLSLLLVLATPMWAADEFEVLSSDGPTIYAGAYGFVTTSSGKQLFVVTSGATADGVLAEGIHVYDVEQNLWREAEVQGDDVPQSVWPGSVVVDGDLLVFGGRTVTELISLETFTRISVEEDGSSVRATVTTETTSGDIPSPRYGFAVVGPVSSLAKDHSDSLYVTGGIAADGFVNEYYLLNFVEDIVWQDGGNLLEPLAGHAAVATSTGFVTIGGSDGTGPTDNVIEYNATDNSSMEQVPMPESLVGMKASRFTKNLAFVTGGVTSDGSLTDRTFQMDFLRGVFNQTAPLSALLTDHTQALVPASLTDGANYQVLIHGGDLGGVASGDTLIYTSDVQKEPDFVLPVVANTPGVGAVFTTQAWFLNAGSVELDFTMSYKSRQGTSGNDDEAVLTLQPNTMFFSSNLIPEVFFKEDPRVGGLLVDVTKGNPKDLVGRTVTTAIHDSGEEYGQAVSLSLALNAAYAGDDSFLFTTEDPKHNRVNVGGLAITNDTVAKITPEKPLGNPLAAFRTVELNRGDSFQINNVFQKYKLDDDADANAIIHIEVVSGALMPLGSVLDGNGAYAGTSDPTTIEPVNSPGSTESHILQLGSISGQGGSQFNGSASVLNPGDVLAEIVADFYRRGSPGVDASATLSVPGGSVLGYSDIGKEVFGVEGDVGTVRFRTDAAGIAAIGREYSIEFDNQGNRIGTAGQQMRGLTDEDLFPPGARCIGVGLRQGGGERSHITFFNPEADDALAEVSLFNGADGALEGSLTYTLPAQQLVQFNNIIRQINPDHDGNEKWIELRVNTEVYGQGFRVNKNNDPVTFDFDCRH